MLDINRIKIFIEFNLQIIIYLATSMLFTDIYISIHLYTILFSRIVQWKQTRLKAVK